MKAGTVNHQLSHRAMTVHVFVGRSPVSTTGVERSAVASSTLDEKVLTLAQQALDSDPLRTMGTATD